MTAGAQVPTPPAAGEVDFHVAQERDAAGQLRVRLTVRWHCGGVTEVLAPEQAQALAAMLVRCATGIVLAHPSNGSGA